MKELSMHGVSNRNFKLTCLPAITTSFITASKSLKWPVQIRIVWLAFQTSLYDLDSFPEDERKEAEGLMEAIADETAERDEAILRKKELTDKLGSQQTELSDLQKQVSGLEAKV